MTKLTSSLIVSVFLLLFPVLCFAQATSSTSAVTGTVSDPTGAVVAGATVKLIDTKTSQERTTTTNDQGIYLFAHVPPGQGYTLKFSATGFETLEMAGIALGVGNTETHNAQLTVGQVTTNVVVTTEATGATLNTTDASIGNVIEERRMKELPIQIRSSPASLIGLQPGVVGNNVGTAATNRVGSVTGARADQGNITVDGIDANDQATGQAFATTGNAPIDAIQEFRTVTANPAASEGRSSGGQIELVTKSGSNEWHGSLREFNRTAATAANSFFNNRSGVPRPQLTRNQYGGSIGGPVFLPRFGEGGPAIFNGKDRLFFFFDYEARRDAQGVSYVRTVPRPSFRNGSLSYINNNPGCTVQNARSNPNCITTLTPAQIAAIDPLGIGGNQALLNFINQRYPLPNDLTVGDGINTAGFRFNAPSHRADNTYTGRVDLNITNTQRLFVRTNKISAAQTDTVNSVAAQFPGDPETAQITTGDWALAVGHNWTPTSNFVNSATVGITKSILGFPNLFHPSSPQSYTFTPLSAPFADFRTQAREVPVWTYRDDVNWTRGSHGFSFGGSLKTVNQRTNFTADYNFATVGLGGTTFASSLGNAAVTNALRPANILNSSTARNSFDSALTFLLGTIPSVSTLFNYNSSGSTLPLTTGRNRDWRYVEYEFYAGDTWKVRNDLALNYGVRWHIYPAPYETHGAQSIQNVDFESLFNLRVSNAAQGIASATSEPFLVYNLGGKANNARPFYETEYNNFAPRFGFAWNPSARSGLFGKLIGDRKTVIRGGGTVTYDRPGGGITFLQDQSTYIFDTTVVNNFAAANGRAALATFPRFTGITSVPVQNVAPPVTLPFTPRVTGGVGVGSIAGNTNYAVDPNFRIPYSIQYTFGFQRELPGNFIFEASYVGRQGRQLFALADAAQILDFKDPASGQFMIAALNQLQSQIVAGGAITPIPWFENQMNPASIARFGVPCSGLGLGPSCTDVVAAINGFEVEIGDTADTIQSLRGNRLLGPNVGLSSQFATNAFVTNKGSSSYDGMLLSLRKRFSNGFRFDANYTWSHSIDNQSTVANTTTSGGLICDATDLRVCRGPSDFDIRHLFNLNGIWELPFGRGRAFGTGAPGWLNAIIGDWEISGIVTARSGLPFSLATVSWPRTFIFDAANGVPAVLSGDLSVLKAAIHDAPDGTIQFFADPNAALAVAHFPRHGQAGSRNFLRSQPYWNVDSAVLKNLRLPWSETQRIQLRWESYNLFNHNVFAPPSTNNNPNLNALNIGSPNFGSITTVQSTARVMQFGIRWDF